MIEIIKSVQPHTKETSMKLIQNAIAVAAILTLGSSVRAADTYTIDPAHTSVGFTITHMMISEVTGRFDDTAGQITLDNGAVTGAKATIQVASVDTAQPKRDGHLKTPDFFDAEKYPTITFEGTKIEKDGDKTVMVGNFTMHGVTKEIRLPFTLKGPVANMGGKGQRLAVLSEITISRKDYGMDKMAPAVGDEVKIKISSEAVKN
jgi:polyisoprenoid-binding protein YceI